MGLPEILKSKYLLRFDELITEGEKIHKDIKVTSTRHKDWDGVSKIINHYHVDWSRFVGWRTSVSTLLYNVIPTANVHYKAVSRFPELSNEEDHLEYGISLLKAIKEDFKNGMFESLASQWEAANL